MADNTTIALDKETRNRLFRLKQEPEENYDDVLKQLLSEHSGKSCDLCNETGNLIDGTFFKRSDHGGLAILCAKCWEKLDDVESGCCLCRGEVPNDPKRRHTIGTNMKKPLGGPVCNDCRRILDWNH